MDQLVKINEVPFLVISNVSMITSKALIIAKHIGFDIYKQDDVYNLLRHYNHAMY
jgi:hypothetical protein